jgi:enoyl-CoA hydratase/carnithine racemase
MSWETVKLDVKEQVATVLMNRPQTRNAMTAQMLDELMTCLKQLAEREDVRILVLSGEGLGFSSGSDLRAREQMTPQETARYRARIIECYDLVENFPVPVIAKVNGAAVAGGFEIALACDIRVAAERAFFAQPEGIHTGSFAGGAGPLRLQRLIGKGRAKLVVFTGRRFSAREAFELGFVEVVCADDKLDEETDALVKQILKSSPVGLRAVKQLINEGAEMHIRAATALSTALRNPLDYSADYSEGIAAWREKRPARFGSE